MKIRKIYGACIGFVLLEVMIVIAIIGLVFAIIAGNFKNDINQKQEQQQLTAQLNGVVLEEFITIGNDSYLPLGNAVDISKKDLRLISKVLKDFEMAHPFLVVDRWRFERRYSGNNFGDPYALGIWIHHHPKTNSSSVLLEK